MRLVRLWAPATSQWPLCLFDASASQSCTSSASLGAQQIAAISGVARFRARLGRKMQQAQPAHGSGPWRQVNDDFRSSLQDHVARGSNRVQILITRAAWRSGLPPSNCQSSTRSRRT